MSDLLIFNDFSAGWCPGDDPVNGRKNGLLKMDNLDLSKNGSIQTCNGTSRQLSAFSTTLHSIFSKYINGIEYVYSADTTGVIFRNNTNIKSSGSITRAAFNAAYNYVFGFSGSKRFRDDGTTTTDLGIVKPSAAPTLATGAAGVLTGDYEYCQINVFKNGTYQAKSARGSIGTLTLTAQQATVTPQNPSVPGSNATEAWIFRRGVNLDTWYRIAKVTTYSSFSDNMSDSDALLLGITMNDYLLSINSTDTPDAILSCVGPVYGRMIYFTENTIIFSDILSPDSYDSRTTIGLGGSSGSEIFKWAILIGKKNVLVGTDRDVYSLSGTYIQLPDGYLDVSLDGLGIDNPPIGIDVALYGNNAIYMSKSGWVACQLNGTTVSLTFPNIDYLYSGQSTFEYGAVTIDPSGIIRYPCCVNKNKLYCIVPLGAPTSAYHMEVYDFQRKYWRPCYQGKTPNMLFSSEKGNVLGFDNTDKFIKIYDSPITKLLDDGTPSRQNIELVSMLLDDGKPKNKKDWFTLSLRGGTNSPSIGVTVSVNYEGHISIPGDLSFSPDFIANIAVIGYYSMEQSWDIFAGTIDIDYISKSIQVRVTGSPPLFSMEDIFITYETRPISNLHLNIQDIGIDSIDLKHISVLNPVINTNGQDVDFYPIVDGVVKTKSTLNTSKKQIAPHYFDSIVAGTIWTGYLIATTNTAFEFYGFLPPVIDYSRVEATKVKLLSVDELFKYGKLKTFEMRLWATPLLTSIPYSIQVDNLIPLTGVLDVVAGNEDIYSISLPKTVAGSILVIILGPTTDAFSIKYSRILVTKSGKNTEEEWIALK